MRRLAVLAVLVVAWGCDSKPPRAEGAGMIDSVWEFATGHWERRPGGVAKTGGHETYNVAFLKARRYSDLDVRVRVRPVSGEADASGGIVVRAQDSKNYYVVRANALEDNFRLYKTVDGGRKLLAGATVTPPKLGEWHVLRLVARGDRLQAYLNDQLLIDHRDDQFREGRVGLWTKEDSVTEFEDPVVEGS